MVKGVLAKDDVMGAGLRDWLNVIRRRKWTIVLVTLVAVASALAASFLQTPVYRGTAELLLQLRNTDSLFDPDSGERNDPSRAVQTEIEVLKSEPVRSEVRKKLGKSPRVSASPVGQTDVIEVWVDSVDPERAAETANAYAKAYIEFRRDQGVADLVAAGEEIQAKLADLDRQVDELESQLPSLASLPPRPTPAELRERTAQEQRLAPRRESLLNQQSLFKQKLDQLQVDAALKTGGALLVTPAGVPTDPVKPTPRRNGIAAAVAGLVFGTGLAFLFEHLDDSVKTKEDIERVVPDLPVLGLIPAVSAWRNGAEAHVISLAEPNSPPAEAYRTLRTSIQFMGLDRPMRTLQVTSPTAAEGKSTTVANLAVALARAGQRVVVLCCDLRRPRIHEFLGLTNNVGFTSVLLGGTSLEDALQPVPGEDRMLVLASGPIPPNPSELLSGRRAVEVLTALQTEADIVVIDSPPVLPVTDAAVLSGRVDATLLVVGADTTTRKELHRAVELLQQVDAPLVGTVLNGVKAEGGYGYVYKYSYPEHRQRPASTARQVV